MLIVVDLPAPLWPSRAKHSSVDIVRLTPSTAFTTFFFLQQPGRAAIALALIRLLEEPREADKDHLDLRLIASLYAVHCVRVGAPGGTAAAASSPTSRLSERASTLLRAPPRPPPARRRPLRCRPARRPSASSRTSSRHARPLLRGHQSAAEQRRVCPRPQRTRCGAAAERGHPIGRHGESKGRA